MMETFSRLKWTNEQRQQQSELMKKKWADPEFKLKRSIELRKRPGQKKRGAVCSVDCKCKKHTLVNSGQFKKGQPPPYNPNRAAGFHKINKLRREQLKAINSNYPHERITWKLKQQVWERDGSKCKRCGIGYDKSYRLVVHHLDYDPSHNVLDNLVLLCRTCHQKGHNRGLWDISLRN